MEMLSVCLDGVMNRNSVQYHFVSLMAPLVKMEIVQHQMFALATLVGLDLHVQIALHCPVAKMDIVKSLWNVYVKEVGLECFVTNQFVTVVFMDLALHQVNVFVILDGLVKIVINV